VVSIFLFRVMKRAWIIMGMALAGCGLFVFAQNQHSVAQEAEKPTNSAVKKDALDPFALSDPFPPDMNRPFRTENSWGHPDPALRAGLL